MTFDPSQFNKPPQTKNQAPLLLYLGLGFSGLFFLSLMILWLSSDGGGGKLIAKQTKNDVSDNQEVKTEIAKITPLDEQENYRRASEEEYNPMGDDVQQQQRPDYSGSVEGYGDSEAFNSSKFSANKMNYEERLIWVFDKAFKQDFSYIEAFAPRIERFYLVENWTRSELLTYLKKIWPNKQGPQEHRLDRPTLKITPLGDGNTEVEYYFYYREKKPSGIWSDNEYFRGVAKFNADNLIYYWRAYRMD